MTDTKKNLCKTCKYGDDCVLSCKMFSGCRTTQCYKYEEGASKIEFKNICIYPTDNENIYVFPTDREMENSEKIRAYCKESLSKCVEFREKYLKSDKECVRSQARVFEGMAEAYADIIERFFKEADND